MGAPEKLIPPHGGYENLKSHQIAQLIYDVTVAFCDRYIDRRDRTHDQMVQAARSGARNIAEGSEASGTSKKIEIKLTGIARASLKELADDYKDFVRHRGSEPWPPDHPALVRFKALRCRSVEQLRAWVKSERHRQTRTARDIQGRTKSNRSLSKVLPPSAELVANAALSLLNVCRYLLGRQIDAQADDFLKNGGFTERLYRLRSQQRTSQTSKRER